MDKTAATAAESTGTGTSCGARCADDPAERRWQNLYEALSCLGEPSPPSASGVERPALRVCAIVLELGPLSPLSQGKLRALRVHFPEVSVFIAPSQPVDARAILERPGAEASNLDSLVAAYASSRGFSPRQHHILALYLIGRHDKEIASELGCEQSTIYEHWRRMARKASGRQKSDLVADFHQYLASSVRGARE